MKSPLVDEIVEQLEQLAALARRVAAEAAGDIAAIAELTLDTLADDGRLFFCGNGGCAATAEHLATEYVVRFRRDGRALSAMALTANTSMLTAGGNDLGFEQVFARQLEALARSGDLLVLQSTTGRSANLVRAAERARELGVRTVAVLAGDGGPLGERVDLALILPTTSGARAQELQLAVGHAVCDLVEARLRAGAESGV